MRVTAGLGLSLISCSVLINPDDRHQIDLVLLHHFDLCMLELWIICQLAFRFHGVVHSVAWHYPNLSRSYKPTGSPASRYRE